MNRRRLIKAGLTGVGGIIGYSLGSNAVNFVGRSLEAAVTGLYNISHDVATEISGAAEKKLQQSADEVRAYIGREQKEREKLSTYWEKVGLLNQHDKTELTRILDNIHHYTQESDLVERLTRLRDRLEKRLVDGGAYLENKQPAPLRRFNEWLSKKISGEEKGSRAAFEQYRERLAMLTKIYDINKDNKLAQADLLSHTAGYFAQAQQEVVHKIDGFLKEGLIKDPEERAFFEQIRNLSKEDPSGRKMADYLLTSTNYLTSLGALSDFRELKNKLTETLGDLTTLQQALDEGIRFKNELREQRTQDLVYLRTRSETFEHFMQQKKEELEQKGYHINYELFPQFKAARDSVLHALEEARAAVGKVAGVAGAVVGAGLTGYLAHKAIKSDEQISRRELLRLREGNVALQKEIAQLRKLNKPLGE